MSGTYWSVDECCWVAWSPTGPAGAPVESHVATAIPRQLPETVEQPAVST